MGVMGKGFDKTMFFKLNPVGEKTVCKLVDVGIVEGKGEGKLDFRYKNNPSGERYKKEGLYWTNNGQYPEGFFHQATVEVKGESLVWSIGSQSLAYAIENSKANSGDIIEITRPEKGKYVVRVLSAEEAPF